MKDVAHHLKHLQKKVVQANRKNSTVRWNNNHNRSGVANTVPLPSVAKTGKS